MNTVHLKNITDISLNDKKIFLRCDLNVPFDDNKVLLDDTRINNIVPTIQYLLQKNAKVIIASHFGRPNGEYKEELSLKKLIPYLEEYLKVKVIFIKDILSENSIARANDLKNGEIILLENLRFYKEEQSNDMQFGQKLSQYADIYINDAFSCCHREHASIDAITQFLPSYAGLLLVNELKNLNDAFSKNTRPQILIIGGKKISTKIRILEHLANKIDKVFIAGAMVNNFLKALGYEIGTSFYEVDYVEHAKNIYEKYKEKIILPNDFVGKNENNKLFIKDISDILAGDCMLDIGSSSCQKLCDSIKNSKIVIWNGPIGFYEEQQFAVSSLYIARSIAYHTQKNNIISVIGGGDAVAAVKLSGLQDCFSYISTGGGAFLELLEKGDLIGFKNLKSKET
ncbi:phosphoglycerate kinase [Candidatus Bandiella numerosa]|uniref:phosphoglycerate kinase n=1 Tax=Candidatus Bandiella numerosa TaxID=2570586 RepID=UPI001F2B40E0|nr:phosphoglycerate kinase [Candidatus Bandiella numerosa]